MISRQPSFSAQRSKQAATGVLGGATYFVAMVVVLHVLRPDLNPMEHPTSAYAIGPFGFLMTTAFFSISMASLALVAGLNHWLPPSSRSRLGPIFLGIWAAGVLIAMIFPMDAEGASLTISGMIHDIDGPLVFLSLTVGMMLVSWRLRQTSLPFHRAALFLSVVMLAAFIATFLSFITGFPYLGLAQRIALATAVTWHLLITVAFAPWPLALSRGVGGGRSARIKASDG